MLIARFYEPIEPMHRGERYEDPLNGVLRSTGAGAVTGGGSQLDATRSIAYAEIEIQLSNQAEGLAAVVAALELAGAPEDSEIRDGSEVIQEFGTHQSLAIYLDGISLPAEVYADLDFGTVVEALESAAGAGSYRGYRQGAQETGIVLVGPDAEGMFARVEPVLRELPIGQNARVAIRERRDRSAARTVRMPRH